jgi:plastocyanin
VTERQAKRFGLLLIIVIAIIVGSITFTFVSSNNSLGFHQSQIQTNCANPCTIVVDSLGIGDGKNTIVISKGTVVQWKNEDSISHYMIGYGNWSFNTGIIVSGQTSKSIQFVTDGIYSYYCATTMLHGEIQVVS